MLFVSRRTIAPDANASTVDWKSFEALSRVIVCAVFPTLESAAKKKAVPVTVKPAL